MITLKEAIEHCKEIALTCNNKECAVDHFQLFKWLEEYQNILEKQGEQPQGKSALEAAKEEKVDNKNCVKPNDKVEPKFKIGQTIKKEGFNLGFLIVKIEDGFYYNDMGDNFPFTDQDNWELVEQNPAWSEEDNIMAHNIDYALRCQITYPKSKLDSMSSWIYNLKNRVKMQPKQEWSEEDLYKIENALFGTYAGDVATRLLNKIKSIRPQNTWKPSLSQLNALGVVAKGNAPDDIEEINSLYNDLKKLREK